MLHILMINNHSPQTFSKIILNYKQWTLKIIFTQVTAPNTKKNIQTLHILKINSPISQSCTKIISSMNLKIESLLKISLIQYQKEHLKCYLS